MSLPYVIKQEVWNLKAVDETKALDSEFERTKVTVIEITTAGFSGTIDIQGKLHEISAFANVPYIRQDLAAIQTPSVAQISHTENNGVVRYVILGYWRRLRLVMTCTAGTITCGVAGSSDAQAFPYLPTKLLANSGVDIGDVGIMAGGAFGEVQDVPTLYTQLRRLKDIVTALAAMSYKFSIGGVNFNEYTKIKTLWLPNNCDDAAHINLKSGATNYQVPDDAVFIALKVSARIYGVGTLGIFGWADLEGDVIAENRDILSVSCGISGGGFMDEVLGVFPADKWVKARTDHGSSEMYANSAIYGVEVPNGS